MEDLFGKVVAIVFLVLGLLFLPLLCIPIIMDNISQASIESAVVEFVDNARSTGKITYHEYEDLCYTIDSFQEFCNIQIKHSSDMVIPGAASNEIEHYYADYNKNDILEVIYESSTTENLPYRMRNGDYLTVTVYNTKPTLATKIYRILMPLYNPSGVTIYVNYGGMIGNNVE